MYSKKGCTYWLRCQWSCETAATCEVQEAQKDEEADPWPPVGLYGPKRGLESISTYLQNRKRKRTINIFITREIA